MNSSWDLKHTNNLNQMLRVKRDVKINPSEYPILLKIKHTYHIADDIMFPDPSCLAFFTAFEEKQLEMMEQNKTIQLVAVDIFEGLMQFYVYCKDAQKSIYESIDFLKSNSNYPVEFEVINDAEWTHYKEFIN